jgi:CheY-like chemotaxis protein/anti-anti-sigma regulatory factor
VFLDLELLGLFYRHAGVPVGPVAPTAIDHLVTAGKVPRISQRLRVLVVNDDPNRAERVAVVVRLGGHDAGTASDGPSTRRLAEVGRPDVVLIDLHFAGLTGFELAQQVVRSTAEGEVLVVAVFAPDHPGQQRWADLGLTGDFLERADPETIARLLLVREWFSIRRRLPPARRNRTVRLAAPLRPLRQRRQRMIPSAPKVERTGNVTIITLTGSQIRNIGNQIAADLEDRTEDLGECHLLLDFSNVERITSEELGTLISLHKRVRASGGRLTLFNLNAQIYEVFTTMHLHTLLAIGREQPPPDRPL